MKRYILLGIGWLCFAVGMIGVVLPVLPTTPFLLLTAALFAGNSPRCEAWLVSSKPYRRYVLPFKQRGGLTMKKKLEILLLVYGVLLISGLLVANTHVRILLAVIAVIKLVVFFRIPTVKEGEVVS